jgi:hypothetical protein
MGSQSFREIKSNYTGVLRHATRLQDRVQMPFESVRLTTMVPKEGLPVGSDRAVRQTVNGILCVRFNDRQIVPLLPGHRAVVSLCGEYAGLPCVIATRRLDLTFPDPMFLFSDGYSFDLFRSFTNLTQNIFLRFHLEQKIISPFASVPIDATFSGMLAASDPRL